jgi:hypothetical protein
MEPVDETYTGEMTTIASRVVSICAMIGDLAEETMNARRVTAISAMIHDVSAEEATLSSTTTTTAGSIFFRALGRI